MKALGIDLDALWWGICRRLMMLIDSLGQAFTFLVGADVTNGAANQGEGGNVNNIFLDIFGGSVDDSNMTRLYMYIMIACVGFMILFVAIGAIKAQFTKAPTDSLQAMGFKTFFALIKMICIPLCFFIALHGMGVIFDFLIKVMSQGTNSTSLAQELCDACNDGTKVSFNAPWGGDLGVGETLSGTDNFNYLQCILASGFLVVTLVTVSITLIKRIIEVFFSYLSAPIALARTPLDDGKSFDLWKENVVSKLLSSGGIIIAMYLFYAIIPQFNSVVDVWAQQSGNGGIASILKLLFILGGSCVPASASMLMAQLISQGAGQNESNNMMHTQQMMGNGLRLGLSASSKALQGAFSGGGKVGGKLLKGGANTIAGAVSPTGGAAGTVAAGIAGAGGAVMRAGGAAMQVFNSSGNNGSTGSGGAATTPAAAVVSRAASGATSQGRWAAAFAPLKNNVLGALKKGWNKAKSPTNPVLGLAGKAGSIGAGAIIAGGGAALGAVAGVAQGVGAFFKAGEKGRHKAHIKSEEKAGKAIIKQANKETKGATARKYSGLDSAMKADNEAGTQKSTSDYLINKIDNFNQRADRVDEFLAQKKQAGWSDERKQEYRRSQLGSEASRIGAFADVASANGKMNEDSVKKFKSFYDRISQDLYGEKPAADKKPEGGDAT